MGPTPSSRCGPRPSMKNSLPSQSKKSSASSPREKPIKLTPELEKCGSTVLPLASLALQLSSSTESSSTLSQEALMSGKHSSNSSSQHLPAKALTTSSSKISRMKILKDPSCNEYIIDHYPI